LLDITPPWLWVYTDCADLGNASGAQAAVDTTTRLWNRARAVAFQLEVDRQVLLARQAQLQALASSCEGSNLSGEDQDCLGSVGQTPDESGSWLALLDNHNEALELLALEASADENGIGLLEQLCVLAEANSDVGLDATSRVANQDSFENLLGDFDVLCDATVYDETSLMLGYTYALDGQVGMHNTASDRISLVLSEPTPASLGLDSASVDLEIASTAAAALDVVEDATSTLEEQRLCVEGKALALGLSRQHVQRQ